MPRGVFIVIKHGCVHFSTKNGIVCILKTVHLLKHSQNLFGMLQHLHYLLWFAVSSSFIGLLLPFMVHYHHQMSICLTTLINVYNATTVLAVGIQNTTYKQQEGPARQNIQHL